MKDKYFVFIYPNAGLVRDLLNIAIFLLNPFEKWPAHITVAGPFYNKKQFALQKRVLDTTVFSLSRGNFFKHGSNAVFLNVGFREREEVWRKPDFTGNPIPHLTLYDGPDQMLANQLFANLQAVPTRFSFPATDLHVVRSQKGQQRNDLRMAVDFSKYRRTVGLSLDSVRRLPTASRLDLALGALTQITVATERQHSFFL